MINFIMSTLRLSSSPRHRIVVWLMSCAILVMLGWLRTLTGAEYTFASAAIIPLVAISWVGGRNDGYAFSLLAAIMWASADFMADRQFSASWIPATNSLVRLMIYAFVSYLIAYVKELLVRENELAAHDELTKLLNRRAFFELGNAAVDRSRRYGHSMAVAFLDLDNFKQLNDTRGHKVGDLALKATAAALRKKLRSTDIIARLGGDEFAVLIPEASFEAAKEAGQKIASAVNAAMKKFSPVSVSVGVSWFEAGDTDFSGMLEAADALMYEIKEEGKHGVRVRKEEVRKNHEQLSGN